MSDGVRKVSDVVRKVSDGAMKAKSGRDVMREEGGGGVPVGGVS